MNDKCFLQHKLFFVQLLKDMNALLSEVYRFPEFHFSFASYGFPKCFSVVATTEKHAIPLKYMSKDGVVVLGIPVNKLSNIKVRRDVSISGENGKEMEAYYHTFWGASDNYLDSMAVQYTEEFKRKTEFRISKSYHWLTNKMPIIPVVVWNFNTSTLYLPSYEILKPNESVRDYNSFSFSDVKCSTMFSSSELYTLSLGYTVLLDKLPKLLEVKFPTDITWESVDSCSTTAFTLVL